MTQPDAAVAIVCTRVPPESVLLILRSERVDDPWSGHWALPGGRCDPEDEDLVQTALRELEEECGIRLLRENLKAALPHVLARRIEPPYLLVAPFLFAVESELPTILDAREAAGSLWVPVRDLRDPARHMMGRAPGRPREILYPGIELNGPPLWGFTYRLIADWLGLVPPSSGFEEAALALQFLQCRGLKLRKNWSCNSAVVDGPIPVEETLAYFSQPTGRVPSLNWVEVTPTCIRMTGPALEEYVIRAESA